MEKDFNKRNIVVVLISILIVIFTFVIVISAIKDNNKTNSNIKLDVKQIYSSDYDLISLDNKYIIGSYKKNYLNVFIDENGKEIINNLGEIYYDSIFQMQDGRYLIYNNLDNKLNVYIFDEEKIEKVYEINDVSYAKPIIYRGIDKQYIVGFVSSVDDNIYLYNLDNKGIIVINKAILVADDNENGNYYIYNDKFLVVKNLDGLMGVVDFDGNLIVDYKYKNIINTYNNSFIAINKNDKYGIIDKNEKILIKFKYDVIDFFQDYYLIVNSNNKMALYNKDYQNITGFKMNYDSLIEYDLRNDFNSVNLYRENDKVVVVNNYMEDKNGTEYDNHNLYVIDDTKIVKTIKQIGFNNDEVIYTYDSKYKIVIYNEKFEKIFTIKLKQVKKIESINYVNKNVIKVVYFNQEEEKKIKYYDHLGRETDFDLGDMVLNNTDYFGYFKKNNELNRLNFCDQEGNYLSSIDGKDIRVYDNYIIVDKSIYKVEIGEN